MVNARLLSFLLLIPATFGADGHSGWIPLSDGHTLNGWHTGAKPADRAKGFWKAAGGMIVCDSRGRKNHDYVWLISDREFSDFELRLQVHGFPESTGNSGVQFRSRYDEQAFWMDGPQVDVHPPAPWRTGLIYDETRDTRRWIFPSLKDWNIAPEQGPRNWKWDEGGWNTIRLIVRGMHVRTVVNGITITDFDGASVLDDASHRAHNVGRRGHIALQLHAGDELYIQYKDLEIRPLP
jgi:hypothetical protein